METVRDGWTEFVLSTAVQNGYELAHLVRHLRGKVFNVDVFLPVSGLLRSPHCAALLLRPHFHSTHPIRRQ